MGVSLGFLGDVMLGRKVDEYRRDGPPEAVWGDVLDRLRSFDGLFANLECCLSTRGRRWTRTHRPFHFRADPTWAVPALRTAGVDWVCLANNHVLDFEEVAFRDTLDALDDGGITRGGAGETGRNAWEPTVFSVEGLDVGLVACTDNTPEYAADEGHPGVAWTGMDVDDIADTAPVERALDSVRQRDPDLIVVSLHWGPNMVAAPDDAYVRFGHWLVDRGVDLIHGHSAHNFQGVERYRDGLICYDCGDAVDDYAVDPGLRNDRGFVFEVRASDDGDLRELRLHPVVIRGCAVHEADRNVAAWCRERMRARSAPFGTADEFERAGDSLLLAV